MKVFLIVWGGVIAALLLGSFLVQGAAQDGMRLAGAILLIAFAAYRIVHRGQGGAAD